jgi:hypothetical protein
VLHRVDFKTFNEERYSSVTGEIGFSPKINVLKLNSRFWDTLALL